MRSASHLCVPARPERLSLSSGQSLVGIPREPERPPQVGAGRARMLRRHGQLDDPEHHRRARHPNQPATRCSRRRYPRQARPAPAQPVVPAPVVRVGGHAHASASVRPHLGAAGRGLPSSMDCNQEGRLRLAEPGWLGKVRLDSALKIKPSATFSARSCMALGLIGFRANFIAWDGNSRHQIIKLAAGGTPPRGAPSTLPP